uniref:Uncharacterized protein n=1 Tax=Lotharella oceanica TaxID=641309 RepID=A0A7S2TXL0_9EUKA|eukprot:CAMPEP_0170171290 /NCGR_PEP_ID=MMETSP0040_2-20121228/4405_1 /TAXON_ID=641309 /ORGANISM="Lotharella oceanica, Strain CCMP622" /LENGTH=308 /DNA_ID=CAMNT_0010411245 /DNA_START=14 /DNA_END=940 /DNA_ORIENTATION=+
MGSKTAYSYAKKLGLSKATITMDEKSAGDVWKKCDPKEIGMLTSIKSVSELLKRTGDVFVSTLQNQQTKTLQAARSKLGSKQYQSALGKLSKSLTLELQNSENTERFLMELNAEEKFTREVFLACVSAGVKIQKDGSIKWVYIANKGKESKGKLESVKEKPNQGLTVPKPSHKKTFSVRQLKVLSKGIYSSDAEGDLKKVKEREKNDPIAKVEAKAEEAEKRRSVTKAKVTPKPPEVKKESAAPEVVKEVAEKETNARTSLRDSSQKKQLKGSRWQNRKMKAMMKFATLRSVTEKKKKKKKKKRQSLE